MNTAEAYIERPVAVLWAGQVWSINAFVARIHPSHPHPLPAQVHTAVRLLPTPCRPVGHDGATYDRFPGIAAGHMKGDK